MSPMDPGCLAARPSPATRAATAALPMDLGYLAYPLDRLQRPADLVGHPHEAAEAAVEHAAAEAAAGPLPALEAVVARAARAVPAAVGAPAVKAAPAATGDPTASVALAVTAAKEDSALPAATEEKAGTGSSAGTAVAAGTAVSARGEVEVGTEAPARGAVVALAVPESPEYLVYSAGLVVWEGRVDLPLS